MAAAATKSRVGEMLVGAGFISDAQLAEALAFQSEKGGKVPHILVHLGHLHPSQLSEFIENRPPMPSVDLANFKSFPDSIGLIPKSYAVANEVFPIDKMGKLLTVGTAIPLEDSHIEELEKLTGLRVKAVLCSADDIHNAIEEHYPSGDADTETPEVEHNPGASEIKLGAVVQILQSIDSLPTLSQTVQKVQEAVQDESIGVREVAEIIEHDPPVTANLLRLANSVAYSFQDEVRDVHRAAALLGLTETEAIVVSSAVLDLAQQSTHFDHQAYWRDATFGALCARAISEARGRRKDAAAFTAGLLHDIGRYALAEGAQGRYAEVPADLLGEELLNAENVELGIAHPEAGYILAEQWGLPQDIATAIRFHHSPELAKEHDELVRVTALAAAFTEARQHGINPASAAKPHLERLNIDLGSGMQIFADAVNLAEERGT